MQLSIFSVPINIQKPVANQILHDAYRDPSLLLCSLRVLFTWNNLNDS